MLPNLFILNNSGDVLIEKHYVGHTKRYVCELFWEEVCKYTQQKEVPPILSTENHYMLNVRRHSLFFLSAVKKDVQPLLVFETIHKIVDTLLEYFKDKINEQMLREQFTLVYQLLDELVIGGFAHTTEMNQLTDMIQSDGFFTKMKRISTTSFSVSETLPTAFNHHKMPWRKPDCKYVSNEIKIDIIEAIDCIIQASNVRDTTVSSSISGSLECLGKLSGQPDLSLTFNNARILDHLQLHRCVRISRWQKEKVISFVPPDGKFTLCKYKIKDAGNLPLDVHPVIKLSNNKTSYNVKITLNKKNTQNKQIDKLFLDIPFPKETLSFTLTATVGKVTQDEISKIVKWNIGKFPKDGTPTLEGSVSLSNDYNGVTKPYIRSHFEIKGLSMTNLRIDSLAVHGVKYKPFKGVRHITRAGAYIVRS